MNTEKAIQLMKDTFGSLHRSSLLEKEVEVNEDTVLLGSGTELDSMGFVTFVTDLEDRLSRENGEDVYLILSDIHEFNVDSSFLSAGILARYVAKLTGD